MEIFEWNENIPVTANNLNEMQNILNNNIKKQYTIIYNNVSGESINLSCNEEISNFDYLQFDFLHQGYHCSTIAPIFDNKVQISSIGIPPGNTVLQFMNQRYTISGSTLTFDIAGMVNISNGTISWQSFDTDISTLKVKRIIGIKLIGEE